MAGRKDILHMVERTLHMLRKDTVWGEGFYMGFPMVFLEMGMVPSVSSHVK